MFQIPTKIFREYKKSLTSPPLVARKEILNLIEGLDLKNISDEEKYKRLHKYFTIKNLSRIVELRYYKYLHLLGIIPTNQKGTIGSLNVRKQIRVIEPNEYQNLIELIERECYEENNLPAQGLLLLKLTGLRSMEINQLTYNHIAQMKNESEEIIIHRKYNKPFTPIYTKALKRLINFIYHTNNIEERIKNNLVLQPLPGGVFSSRVLSSHLKKFFIKANNSSPPYGFGLHMFRYMEATRIFKKTNNIYLAKHFLAHDSPVTTKVYLRETDKENANKIDLASNNIDFINQLTTSLE